MDRHVVTIHDDLWKTEQNSRESENCMSVMPMENYDKGSGLSNAEKLFLLRPWFFLAVDFAGTEKNLLELN